VVWKTGVHSANRSSSRILSRPEKRPQKPWEFFLNDSKTPFPGTGLTGISLKVLANSEVSQETTGGTGRLSSSATQSKKRGKIKRSFTPRGYNENGL